MAEHIKTFVAEDDEGTGSVQEQSRASYIHPPLEIEGEKRSAVDLFAPKPLLLDPAVPQEFDDVGNSTAIDPPRFDDVVCPVCLHHYNQSFMPLILDCGHSTCSKCLQRYPDVFQCQCGVITRTMEFDRSGSLTSLLSPSSFLLKFAELQQKQQAQPSCDCCSSPAQYYCPECKSDNILCAQCFSMVHNVPKKKGHQGRPYNSNTAFSRCMEHGLEFSRFCTEHMSLVCPLCLTVENHKQCVSNLKILELEEAYLMLKTTTLNKNSFVNSNEELKASEVSLAQARERMKQIRSSLCLLSRLCVEQFKSLHDVIMNKSEDLLLFGHSSIEKSARSLSDLNSIHSLLHRLVQDVSSTHAFLSESTSARAALEVAFDQSRCARAFELACSYSQTDMEKQLYSVLADLEKVSKKMNEIKPIQVNNDVENLDLSVKVPCPYKLQVEWRPVQEERKDVEYILCSSEELYRGPNTRYVCFLPPTFSSPSVEFRVFAMHNDEIVGAGKTTIVLNRFTSTLKVSSKTVDSVTFCWTGPSHFPPSSPHRQSSSAFSFLASPLLSLIPPNDIISPGSLMYVLYEKPHDANTAEYTEIYRGIDTKFVHSLPASVQPELRDYLLLVFPRDASPSPSPELIATASSNLLTVTADACPFEMRCYPSTTSLTFQWDKIDNFPNVEYVVEICKTEEKSPSKVFEKIHTTKETCFNWALPPCFEPPQYEVRVIAFCPELKEQPQIAETAPFLAKQTPLQKVRLNATLSAPPSTKFSLKKQTQQQQQTDLPKVELQWLTVSPMNLSKGYFVLYLHDSVEEKLRQELYRGTNRSFVYEPEAAASSSTLYFLVQAFSHKDMLLAESAMVEVTL